ncbi:MAG: YicC/YloC family endoribonuclease [Bacteroidota bacterium]
MILSMTGYGKSELSLPHKKISIEVKSLNSKNFDMNARMPSQYREKELEIRNKINQALHRGKVDFSMQVELTGEESSTKINPAVVKNYLQQIEAITPVEASQKATILQIALQLPDAVSTDKSEIEEQEFKAILETLDVALEKIVQYRRDEGKSLENDFRKRIGILEDLLQQVIEIDPQRIEAVKAKLHSAVKELKENVDENRFEQELIYYLEKYDITEEKTRLKNHLAYFIETIDEEGANGKKLGFIGQEIGREINTVGSKSNFAPMQKIVVQMKDELEKIKEQLLNVL